MEIRFYVFWCGWFQVFVVEIRITIITATFLPEQITTTTVAPTTVTQITPKSEKMFYNSVFRPSALQLLQVETFI